MRILEISLNIVLCFSHNWIVSQQLLCKTGVSKISKTIVSASSSQIAVSSPDISSRLLSRYIACHKVEQQRFHKRYRRHVVQKVRAKPSVIMAQVLMAPSNCSRISSVIQRRCHAIVRQIIRVMSYYVMCSYHKLFYIFYQRSNKMCIF